MADEALVQVMVDALRASNFAGWLRVVAGYKELDGSIRMHGAGDNKTWVRPREDSRGGTAVWGSAAFANAPLVIGPNIDGEYEVKNADQLPASISFGDGARVITLPPGMDELVPRSIPAKALKIGRVELSPTGGLNFRVSKHAYTGGYWTSEADQDASGEEPGTAGYVCWVGAYHLPSANTVGVASTTPVFGEPQDLDESDLADLVYPAGAVPLGPAFTLKNGQTQLSQSRFADLDPRIFLRAHDSDTPILSFGAGVIKTLASDIAAAGDDRHLILAAQSSTTDNLIEITGLDVGDEVIIRADAGDTITVKHNDAGATDKIILYNAADIALSGDATLKLAKIASGKVVQYVDESGTGGAGAPDDAEYLTTAAHGDLTAEVVIPGLAGSADIAGAARGGFVREFDNSAGALPTWNSAVTSEDIDTTVKSHYYARIADNTERFGTYAWSPAGAFDLRAKISVGAETTGVYGAHLLVADAGNTSRAIVGIDSNTNGWQVVAYTYASSTYTQRGTSYAVMNNAYLRITRDGSNNVAFWYSSDGIQWRRLATLSFTFTPTLVGIRTAASANPYTVAVDWIGADV